MSERAAASQGAAATCAPLRRRQDGIDQFKQAVLAEAQVVVQLLPEGVDVAKAKEIILI